MTSPTWLADGFIAGEQVTPGAPWKIRINAEFQASIVQQASPEYLPMLEATAKLGVSHQTGLERIFKVASFGRELQTKSRHLLAVAHQDGIFNQHRMVPRLALDRLAISLNSAGVAETNASSPSSDNTSSRS
jgi:hypothetical protein